jgi:tRNA(Ile)-lysidine synthase
MNQTIRTIPHSLLGDEKRVLLAISGGPDSTALLHLAAEWQRGAPHLSLHAATVNHCLRETALEEAQQVARQARDLGITHDILTWEGPKPATGIQEKAREIRYQLLLGLANRLSATHIVTAHTLDDQIETFLMRLCHGSGLKGLGAMREATAFGKVVLLRPFLGTSKEDLLQLCHQHSWTYAKDPSNHNLAFARPRFRKARAVLEQEGLTPQRLATTTKRLAEAHEALDHYAQKTFKAAFSEGRLDLKIVVKEPFEIALRVMEKALEISLSQEIRPIPKARLETFTKAMLEEKSGTRSLAGLVAKRDKNGFLILTPETRRKRGSPKIITNDR